MRKLLLVGIMVLCVGFVYAQDDGYRAVLKPDSIKNDLKFLDGKYSDLGLDTIIQIFTTPQEVEKQSQETAKTPPVPTNSNIQKVETQPQEIVKTPPTPANESLERSSSSSNITSSGSSRSSSARKSSSRKRSKRKKISLKRKRPNKIKRKRKMGNRAACPRF